MYRGQRGKDIESKIERFDYDLVLQFVIKIKYEQ